MKLIPTSLSRAAGNTMLKVNASSPTILVVAGVVGFGATAVLAARATRNAEPVIERHVKSRNDLANVIYTNKNTERQDLVKLYTSTAFDLTRVYGPTLALGTASAASILYGHKILKGRHVATMLAYSGLQDQFLAYRGRIAKTLGEATEREIYNGAHAEWVEDENHKGEYKLATKYEETPSDFLRPVLDKDSDVFSADPISNYLFLKGVQAHMNNMLHLRGHVFLNEVADALRLPRTREGAVLGWKWQGEGDNYVDFGFMTGTDPQSIAFREGRSHWVQLNFNVDGPIWDKI